MKRRRVQRNNDTGRGCFVWHLNRDRRQWHNDQWPAPPAEFIDNLSSVPPPLIGETADGANAPRDHGLHRRDHHAAILILRLVPILNRLALFPVRHNLRNADPQRLAGLGSEAREGRVGEVEQRLARVDEGMGCCGRGCGVAWWFRRVVEMVRVSGNDVLGCSGSERAVDVDREEDELLLPVRLWTGT